MQMSYLEKIEYDIILKDSFGVIRRCSKCGKKTYFENTKRFRINANGNKLDIWLIYQCEECKHTLNLVIYERQKVSFIPREEYQRFLDNDEELAEMYGKSIQLFSKNKYEIDFERVSYKFVPRHRVIEGNDIGEQLVVAIHNPYGLRIHPEKQVSEVLGLPRSQVKRLLESGEIAWDMKLSQLVAVRINSCLLPSLHF